MKNVINRKNLMIGDGTPKIVVPIVDQTRDEILSTARKLSGLNIDIIEWRVDFYKDVADVASAVETLEKLKQILGSKLILFTFRTVHEGGNCDIDLATYTKLNKAIAETGNADFVDVEIMLDEDVVRQNINNIQAANVLVVASNHDFDATPPKEELIARMLKMQDFGADILKIAMMPRNQTEVLNLLAATYEMSELHARRPIVTMSMGPLGVISRISGEIFGSAMTFAAVGKTSAPGQIPLEDLEQTLSIIHRAL